MSIDDAVRKHSRLPRERLIIAAADDSIGSVRRGILFVLATWSAPSLVALRDLTSVLAADPNASLPLIVVDAEAVTDARVQELGTRPQGQGETFWVRDGCVIGSILRWDTPRSMDQVRKNNAALSAP